MLLQNYKNFISNHGKGGKFEIGRIYFVKRNEHIKKATTFIFLQSNIL